MHTTHSLYTHHQVWTDGTAFQALENAADTETISVDEYNHIARMHLKLREVEKAAIEKGKQAELLRSPVVLCGVYSVRIQFFRADSIIVHSPVGCTLIHSQPSYCIDLPCCFTHAHT